MTSLNIYFRKNGTLIQKGSPPLPYAMTENETDKPSEESSDEEFAVKIYSHANSKPKASDSIKNFISQQLKIATKLHRDDYRKLLNLALLMNGLDIQVTIWKPGGPHRARWMAKAIYSLKMELLFNGNEASMALTAREFQGMQRFNRFVVCAYLQSWFTYRSTVDAPPNDVLLIERL
ncbi:hypothetical protein AVEN_40025-1 [Araneus ventricosus]|uniref:Uncharacterized protein n=1 Tax=Araneus ventricosus TaxID=182803 RepID=A0A4Y2RSM4_ARAVE|nr:hypothetical protein AVEN_40025-1 [Araneus ventricosus]